ncbi:hypothetical protein NEDG_02233 [Nematocida displodere]|uniref:RING-type domain-containing protein n=1 Tax=Nematocida displodere TaxID=1805483 RepID=A0A177EFY7_9MICR|nr:hypothetical protein NEDG_02233 [Nematocida displodere]
MESKTVISFSNLFTTGLRWALVCLAVLSVGVFCTQEESLDDHMEWTPQTNQTIEFFEKGSFEWCPGLETVEKDGKRHIRKEQSQWLVLLVSKHSLETVPENLVQGIVFTNLTISSTGQNNSAVVEKILNAFGTITADWLELDSIVINGCGSDNDDPAVQGGVSGASGVGPSEQTPTQAPLSPTCRLNINNLKISNTSKPSIKWLLERIDLSGSRIGLAIACGTDFGNLEVLNRFNAASITRLVLYDIDKLNSLDCKLFQEGPLPGVLDLQSNSTATPKMSEQIIQNMLATYWMDLHLPESLWQELMQPSEQPKHLTAKTLKITLEAGSTIPPPAVGMNRATTRHLTIDFASENDLPTTTDLEQTLEWASRGFEGLEELSVLVQGAHVLGDFARNNKFEITTIPTLTSIRVCGIECSVYQSKKETILCLSLEAWELYTKGKLADELTSSRTDLSALSPKQQEIVMNRKEIVDKDKEPCLICRETFDELKKTNPNTEICVLDYPTHRVCGECLDSVINSSGDAVRAKCPFCREHLRLPLIKHKIHKNSQGDFGLTLDRHTAILPVLSFPRTAAMEH